LSKSLKPGEYAQGSLLLFEEEVTICGEERLDSGKTDMPFAIAFPDRPLPTTLNVRPISEI